MANEQLKLLNGPDKKSLGGPIFDFGPGWGFYVKRWFGRYLFKIVLPAIVVIVAMGIFVSFVSRNDAENNEKATANEKITVSVARGDSHTLLARKALMEYLNDHPEESLTGGQKIFIEDNIRRTLSHEKLVIGDIAEFSTEDIKTAITQAKQLTPFQLEAWEKYARGIKF